MTMKHWIAKLDDFLKISERDTLTHAGSISHEEALSQVRAEYEKHRQAHLNDASPVERHFLQAAKEVQTLAGRRKRGKKKGDLQ
jgi:hypothetical protein